MIPILLDRFTTGFSLSIHIILASIGIALPIIMSIMEFIGIRVKDQAYILFAKRMTPVLIVLFAVGTASGILVALELFFLWPNFMSLISQVAILPFYIEVFAFFAEAIFLGIYAYSWNKKLGKYTHWLMSLVVAGGATASGALIIMINAFMNTPTGFNIPNYLATGVLSDINPLAVFTSASVALEMVHGIFASIFAGTFIFLGFFIWKLYKSKSTLREYYKKAVKTMLIIVMIAVLVLIISGILSIQQLIHTQPEKYAALEGNLVNSSSSAPERIGGIPVTFANGSTGFEYDILIPGLQGLLAGGAVPGLNQFNESTWPPLIVHPMFDAMFFIGLALGIFLLFVLVLLIFNIRKIKKYISGLRKGYVRAKLLWLSSIDPLINKTWVILTVIAAVFSVILLEDGWVMAELARQPWIIYNVMTVTQAGNPSSSIIPILIALIAFYIIIVPFTIIVLKRVTKQGNLENDLKKINKEEQ